MDWLFRAIEFQRGLYEKKSAILFTGCVQGVGFRFRVCQAAQRLGLTGWVRNELDGSVIAEVQGEQHDVSAMPKMLQRGFYITIDHIDSRELTVDPDEKSFRILH
ncbi:acylphosphatase [Caproiciproducens faecalis]|uniref:acylphosphatase n=1 Tax=Caproiciproducens faecalis TaxID=2820301 RepID=A0ABS7DMV5_9FIRM|nr:acylphosphatase [Caproiciproducens faecalis]MBW7572402.1 acylphosphatase [Caproiciproducens faecalis]